MLTLCISFSRNGYINISGFVLQNCPKKGLKKILIYCRLHQYEIPNALPVWISLYGLNLSYLLFLCLKIAIYFLNLHIRSKKYIGQNRQKMKTGSLVNFKLRNVSLKINLQIKNIKIIK